MLDRSAEVLDVLKKQGNAPAAVEVAEAFDRKRDEIRAARLSKDFEQEKLSAALAERNAGFRKAAADSDAVLDVEKAAKNDAAERERRAASAERRELKDVIDVEALRRSDDAAEISALLADADRAGDVVGAAARKIALVRVRELAAREQRSHRIGGPMFGLLCKLTAVSTGRATTASAIEEEFAMKKKAAREAIAEVAAAVGAGDVLRRAAVQAAAEPGAPKSSYVVGAFWEKFSTLRRGQ